MYVCVRACQGRTRECGVDRETCDAGKAGELHGKGVLLGEGP